MVASCVTKVLIAVLAAAALVATPWVHAAPPKQGKRIGVMLEAGDRAMAQQASLRSSLEKAGYVEGRNLQVVWKLTSSDVPENEAAARELVAAKVDAIVTRGTLRTRAAQKASTAVPIVTSLGDAVASGFAKSVARPGGNVTGLTYEAADPELDRKIVGYLRTLVPGMKRLIVLAPSEARAHPESFGTMLQAARSHGLEAEMAYAADLPEYRRVLGGLTNTQAGGVFVGTLPPGVDARQVAAAAVQARVAAIGNSEFLVENGLLFTYLLQHEAGAGRIVEILDKVLNGASPAELPFVLPRNSRMVINKLTADALRLVIPAELRNAADRVIE
jgi:putative ABC transport system substrate-binding protein